MDLLQRSIHQLPRNEKLSIMEFIWKDLSKEENELESPEWHRSALAETEKRMNEEKEEEIDWDQAKKQLRKSFE